jgi:hypothetical protein
MTELNELQRQFHKETRESGGVFEAVIIRIEHGVEMLLSGDKETRCFFEFLQRWHGRIRKGWRPLCLACEHEFNADELNRKLVPTFCWVRPIRQDATMAMIIGVCEICSEKDDKELLEVAYQGCREIGLAREKCSPGGRA